MIETPIQLLDRKREVFVKSLGDGIGISEAAREYFNIYKSVNAQDLFYTIPDEEWNLVRIAKEEDYTYYSNQGLMETPSGSATGYEGAVEDLGRQPGIEGASQGESVTEALPYFDMRFPKYLDSTHDSIQPHEAGRTFKGSKYMSEEDYNPMRKLVEHPTYGKEIKKDDGTYAKFVPAFIQTLLDYYRTSFMDEHHAGKSRAEYNLERSKIHYQHHKNDQMYQDHGFLGKPNFENHNYKQYENHYHKWLNEIKQKYDISHASYGQLREAHLNDTVNQWMSEGFEVDEDGTKHQVGLGPFDYFKGFEWMTPRQRTAAYAHINEHGTDREDKQKFPKSDMDAHRVKYNWTMRYAPFHDYQVRPPRYANDHIEVNAEDLPQFLSLNPTQVASTLNSLSPQGNKGTYSQKILINGIPIQHYSHDGRLMINKRTKELPPERLNTPIEALAEHMFLQANPDYIKNLNELVRQRPTNDPYKDTMSDKEFGVLFATQLKKLKTFDIPMHDIVHDEQGIPVDKLPSSPFTERNLTTEGFLHAIGYDKTTGNYDKSPFPDTVTRDIINQFKRLKNNVYMARITRNIGKIFSSQLINPEHEQFDFMEDNGRRDRRGFAGPFGKMFQGKPGLGLHPNQSYDILHANSVLEDSEYGTHSMIGHRVLDEDGKDNIVTRYNLGGMLAHRGQRDVEVRQDKQDFNNKRIMFNKKVNDWFQGGMVGDRPEFGGLKPKQVIIGSSLLMKVPRRDSFPSGKSGQARYSKAFQEYNEREAKWEAGVRAGRIKNKLEASDVHNNWNFYKFKSNKGMKTGVSNLAFSTSAGYMNRLLRTHQDNASKRRGNKEVYETLQSIHGKRTGHLGIYTPLNRQAALDDEVDVHLRSQHANHANTHLIASMAGAGAPPGNPVDVQGFILGRQQHNRLLPLTTSPALLLSNLTDLAGDSSLDYKDIDFKIDNAKIKLEENNDKIKAAEDAKDKAALGPASRIESQKIKQLEEERTLLRNHANKLNRKKNKWGITRQKGIELTAPLLDIMNDDQLVDWWKRHHSKSIEDSYHDSSKRREYIANKIYHDNQLQKVTADMEAISDIAKRMMGAMGLPEGLFADNDRELQLGNLHNLLAFAESQGFSLTGREGIKTLNSAMGDKSTFTYNGGQLQSKLKTIVDDNGDSDMGRMQIKQPTDDEGYSFGRFSPEPISPNDFRLRTAKEVTYKLNQLMRKNNIRTPEQKKAFQYRVMSVKDAMNTLSKDLPEDESHDINRLLHLKTEKGEEDERGEVFANKLGLHYVDSDPPYLISTPHIKSEAHNKISLPAELLAERPIDGDNTTYCYFNIKDKNIKKWPLKTNLRFSMMKGRPRYTVIPPEERNFVSAPKVCYDKLIPNFVTRTSMSGVQKAPLLLASLTDPDVLVNKGDVKTPILQPMHRIFELDDLENLRGFSGDWIVTALPKGQRMFVEKKDDEVKVKGDYQERFLNRCSLYW